MRRSAPSRRSFVEHLLGETRVAARHWSEPRPFDTVYFGGGTPSVLSEDELARVLEGCRRHLRVTPDAWSFLEANPEDVTPQSCAAWQRLGVRTLSLGVQSFDDEELRFLGRRHSAAGARRAVETARAAGFATVSVDLIYGLPGQDAGRWERNLRAAVTLGPEHFSCYQLTVHARTGFGVRAARGQLVEMPDTDQAALFDRTHRFLTDAGWPAYEVSNFARGPEHRSRHNRKYWDHTPYLGLGPSAHSLHVPSEGPPAARRWWNERLTPRWQERVAAGDRPLEGEEGLDRDALALETVMLGLRTTDGIDLDAFAERYGVDLAMANAGLLARLLDEGKADVGPGVDGRRRLALTRSGLAVADGLAAAFAIDRPA